MLLPLPGSKLSDSRGGVLPDTLKHIDKVRVDTDTVEPTGHGGAL